MDLEWSALPPLIEVCRGVRNYGSNVISDKVMSFQLAARWELDAVTKQAKMSSALVEGWPAYVARCEGACCVVGTDGNILAANGALAARVGCQPEQLQAEPLTSLLASGQLLPPQFEDVLRCGVQGVTLASSHLDIPWRSGAVERVEVRVSPMYDEQSGSMRQILVSVMPTCAAAEASEMSEEALPLNGGDASMMDASSSDAPKLGTAPAATTVEGLRNVAGPVQQLLDQESGPRVRVTVTVRVRVSVSVSVSVSVRVRDRVRVRVRVSVRLTANQESGGAPPNPNAYPLTPNASPLPRRARRPTQGRRRRRGPCSSPRSCRSPCSGEG
jgi:hypothetical protein